MIIQERTNRWVRSTAQSSSRSRVAALPQLRIASPARLIDNVHPILWLRTYPLVLPVMLLAVSGLVYMLQVNEADSLNFTLSQLQYQQMLNSGRYATLAAEYDSLTSCQRVCTEATAKLGMTHADLTQALWITVQLPRHTLRIPTEPTYQTGPKTWIQSAWAALKDSL